MDLETGVQRDILEPKTRSRKSSTSKKDPAQVINNLLPIKSEPNEITNEDSNSSDLNSALLEDDASQTSSQISAEERSEPAAGSMKKGRWSKEEDELLLSLVQKTGDIKDRWARIAAQIPGRVHRQCRDRYAYLKQHEGDPKGPWSDEEDAKIIELVQKYGHSWRDISKVIGRSLEATKNHFHAVVKRKMEKENVNPQFIASRIGAAEPPAKTASPGSASNINKEPAPKQVRILQSPLPKGSRPASAEKKALATSSEQVGAASVKPATTSQVQSAKPASLPQSKAQTLDQVILEQKANSQSVSSLFGSPKNLSGKATTRFRLIGSTIQFENKPQVRSISADQLDVTIRPVPEQKAPQPVPKTTNGVSPANSARSSSASKIRSKRKLFGEETAVTSASESVKAGDESIDRSNVEETSSIQASSDVNSSISEMDLTLQHQSVDASLNQSLLMSPNASLLDDSLTSPSHTSKLNLSQLNLGSPTFKNKRAVGDLASSPSVSSQIKAKNNNSNNNNSTNSTNEAVDSGLASSVEIPLTQQSSDASVDTMPASQKESSNSAQNNADSKLKARSKSLTELFTQSQLNTIIAAPPKPAVVPAVTLGRSVSAQVIPGFKISLKKKEEMKKPYSDLIPPPPPPPPVIPVVASDALTTAVTANNQVTAPSQQEEAAMSSMAPEAASGEPAKPASAPTTKGKRGRKRKSSLDSVKKKIDFDGEAEVLASGSILDASHTNETGEPPKKKLKPSPVPTVRASRRSSRLSGESIPKFPNLESVAEEKAHALEPEQQEYLEHQEEDHEFSEEIYAITGIEGLDDQTATNLFAQGEMLVTSQAEEPEMFTGDLHLSCNEELDANEVIVSTQGEAGATDAVFDLLDESDILGNDDVDMNSAHLFGDFAVPWY
eukprot:TRINITY_DN11168_c0_g1_i1.p1 TRINITY_DN11168_c0_g1~~TRINITY_DN11168_c0_g1_i1.p1  ORF type:complete len:895 (+),score=154.12 TRINITY_DN11168_c0_g1_i1:113-2797(+)